MTYIMAFLTLKIIFHFYDVLRYVVMFTIFCIVYFLIVINQLQCIKYII